MKKLFNTIKNKARSANKGFTLIETLIAITVLVVAVVAPLEIASKALFSAFYARDEITAFYLAEEAVEYIKNSRDTTFLRDTFDTSVSGQNNQDWLLGLENCVETNSSKGCYINTTIAFNPYVSAENNQAVVACPADTPGADCPKLKYNTTTGVRGYDSIGGTSDVVTTKFTRRIFLIPQTNANGQDEALIKVTIEWPGLGVFSAGKTFTLYGSVFNWQRK